HHALRTPEPATRGDTRAPSLPTTRKQPPKDQQTRLKITSRRYSRNRVREAYAGIGEDEKKHHESGRELLLWLISASEGKEAAGVIGDAHERAVEGSAMSWSWP
ncbi:MAG: hypothetical protein JO345_13315, partial [Streptosporangiaceae bacterium]|nr:hypothetical protein [Pseudonocardiales bacterium]MBV9446855.1 hypothetical protein [Streptosporangiaceae bacterium]